MCQVTHVSSQESCVTCHVSSFNHLVGALLNLFVRMCNHCWSDTFKHFEFSNSEIQIMKFNIKVHNLGPRRPLLLDHCMSLGGI